MKKTLFFSLLMVLAFASCKQNYTCICHNLYTGGVVSNPTVKASNGVAAITACEALGTDSTSCMP